MTYEITYEQKTIMGSILGKIYNRVLRILRIRFLYEYLIQPKNTDPDIYRKEYVLNTILLGSVFMIGFLGLSVGWSLLVPHGDYSGIPPLMVIGLTSYFILLLVLSRKGYWFASSIFLIMSLFLVTLYAVTIWSFVLPMIILGSVLIIVISGILFSQTISILVTLGIIVALGTITYLQIAGLVPVNLYWRNDPISVQDILDMGIIFLLVNGLTWLSNRETYRSLRRAQASEQALIAERDLLEERIEERTRELKELQERQVEELRHLADFGNRSSGIFHDLMTPLTSITALVDQLPDTYPDQQNIRPYLEKAVRASKRIGEHLALIKKEFRTEPEATYIPSHEIRDAIDILGYRARMMRVHCATKNLSDETMPGNGIIFHRVILNLIKNAIDAYEQIDREEDRTVIVSCSRTSLELTVSIIDHGPGIPNEYHDKIFEPFFTTNPTKGMGIGLSHTKKNIERHLNGTISFTSSPEGTTFVVRIPIHTS